RQRTSMDLAAFANTALVRYLDCNDTYAARGTGHPSDMIPAVLATADGRGAGGRDVITAIAAAYEAFCRLADKVPLKGWDQGIFVAVGAAWSWRFETKSLSRRSSRSASRPTPRRCAAPPPRPRSGIPRRGKRRTTARRSWSRRHCRTAR